MKQINRKIKVISGIILALTINYSRAQYDAMFTQYMFNEVFINPAYAGSKDAMSVTLLHRQQWVNFPGRPVTTSFAMHGPLLGNKMGVGISVITERIGVLNRTLAYGDYAYRLKLNKNSIIAFGLMGGLDNQLERLSDLKISNRLGAKVDPGFAGSPSTAAFNFGTGLYYSNQNAYAGVSIPRMLDNKVKFDNSGTAVKVISLNSVKYTYYITGGYLFNFSNDYKLRASGMLKMVKNAPAQIDVTGSLFIQNVVWAGLSYRTSSAVSAIVGLQANKQLLISYSLDIGTNKIQAYSQGSHEIVLNYLFSFTGKKIITPRYF